MPSVVKYALNAVVILVLLLLFGSSAVWNGASNTLERELGRVVEAPHDGPRGEPQVSIRMRGR